MSNYYEILGVSKDATLEKIEEAIDKQYNQWRQLVSHHDPETVNQANQALLVLEEIRSTLLDDTKRNNYNDTLILNEKVGGLGDPSVFLKEMSSSGKRSQENTKIEKLERVDAWICNSCDKVNPIGTRFCQKCGKEIAKACPSCNIISPINSEFCPECGVNKIKVFEKQKADEYKRINSEIEQVKGKILNIRNGNYPYDLKEKKKKVRSDTLWLLLLIAADIVFLFIEIDEIDFYLGYICSLPYTIIGIVFWIKSKNLLRKSIKSTINSHELEIKNLEEQRRNIKNLEY